MNRYPLHATLFFTAILICFSCKKSADGPASGDNGIPVVSAITISGITQSSASCATSVSSDGGAPVTFRGICYGLNPEPTIAGTKTLEGTGTGNFVSNLKGLTDGGRYYVRAYATNSKGTAYGPQQIFFALVLGELFQGGKLAYLLKKGDPGYAVDVAHGLVAAVDDYGTFRWNDAVKVCADLVEGGHDDWSLPNSNEMDKLYQARVAIGNFTLTTYYWTSTEASTESWIQSFITGAKSTYSRTGLFKVRAVRSF